VVHLHGIAGHREGLVRYVSNAFPGASIDTVEDAVSYAYEVVLARPHLLEEARRRGGEHVTRALMRRIAWRSARDEWRSHRRRTDVLAKERGRFSGERSEVGMLDLALSVDGLVDATCRSFPLGCRSQLAAAVRRRMFGGLSDAEVAAEFRVRREYVQRCRSTLVAQLAAA
jgi:DNA-directed RNA polymerase specialized sigma24 family protein